MRTATYSECRESGIGWLGVVPAAWKAPPLWALYERIKNVGHPEQPMLSVFREHGVVYKKDHANLNKTAENRDIYQLVGPGWLVTNRMKAWQGSVGISEHEGIVSGHYICFRPRHDENHRYLNYLFRSDPYAAAYATLSRGVRIGQAEIDNDLYRQLPVLLPSHPEQASIVEFLDAHTAKIDALIGKQERLIETLAERRQAVITHAVTKGLDPNAPMKASGIEWLGLVPSHWNVAQVKKGFDVTLGKMLDAGRAERPGDEVLPYIRAANIQERGLNLTDVNSMPFAPKERNSLSLRKSDLLVVEGGAVGVCVQLNEDMPGWSFQKTVNRVRARGGNSTAFLGYFLNAIRLGGVIDMLCNKSTIAHFTAEKLNAVTIALPPVDQQTCIVEYLDRETAQVDALSSKAREMIVVLKERRQALISAAVTGKIDVRGLS